MARFRITTKHLKNAVKGMVNKEKTLQDAETKLNIMEAKKKQLTLQKEEIERIKINCK